MLYESKWNYLEHYGVKGQKHGLRRFQNEDGSLTAEGRDHYGVGGPRKAGGLRLHDKQGNPVRIRDNIKAGYRNLPRTAKAGFKALFKKKNKQSVARGIQKKSGNSETENAQTPKKMSKQQKIRKAYKTMGTVVKVAAGATVAAALAYGVSKAVKNRQNGIMSQSAGKRIGDILKGRGGKPNNAQPGSGSSSDRAKRTMEELRARSQQLNDANKRVDDQLARMNQRARNLGGSGGSGGSRPASPKRDSGREQSAPKRDTGRTQSTPKRDTSSSSRSNSANDRARRNLEELQRINREREERMNQIDRQLSDMNRRARGESNKRKKRR